MIASHLFNHSLACGVVPEGFKEAIITPIIKSSKLDAAIPSSYRDISLLLILSKVLESVVYKQLTEYLNSECVLSDYQFGFRRGQSTEDLLAKATFDWSVAKDKHLTSVIAFIDLSKAFDRVNHQALPLLLQQIGIGW